MSRTRIPERFAEEIAHCSLSGKHDIGNEQIGSNLSRSCQGIPGIRESLG